MTDGHTQSLRIVYFAWVRERIGRSEETLTPPAHVSTIAELMSWLKTRGPEYAEAFKRPEIIRAAIDRTHTRPDARIKGAGEVAFFPPVTGG
jgi:molybdopterin synthase sulfur carrier subunit